MTGGGAVGAEAGTVRAASTSIGGKEGSGRLRIGVLYQYNSNVRGRTRPSHRSSNLEGC